MTPQTVILKKIISAAKVEATAAKSAASGNKQRALEEARWFKGLKRLEELKDSRLSRKQRAIFGNALLRITEFWIIGIFAVLMWQGSGYKTEVFRLSDGVLVTLLVTTTANVLGLLYVVVRSLFGDGKAGPDIKKDPAES